MVATVPLDESFLRAVRSRGGLGDTGLLAIARGTTVTAGPATGTELRVRAGEPTAERALGRRYRALSTTLVGGPSALSFVALAPAARSGGWIVLLEVALLVLALAAAATALLGGRGRASPTAAPAATVRDAVALVGDTLAATHNPEALLPVILAAAIEASGAVGGELLEDGRLVSRRGTIDAAARPLSADLGDAAGRGIRLLLWPPADGFSSEAEEAAAWFAEQATIALENARLHRIVEHQAVTDALTELANRRSFIDRLATEIGRAERFGSPLTLVLADLDDFKRINDRFGHMTGDDVLVAFARILRASVREIDLPVRLGGEEFALVLPDTDLAGGVRLAERLRLTLAQSRIPTDSESGAGDRQLRRRLPRAERDGRRTARRGRHAALPREAARQEHRRLGRASRRRPDLIPGRAPSAACATITTMRSLRFAAFLASLAAAAVLSVHLWLQLVTPESNGLSLAQPQPRQRSAQPRRGRRSRARSRRSRARSRRSRASSRESSASRSRPT